MPEQQTANPLGMIIPIAVFALVFYFFIYRPQKKQERETSKMRNSISVGDEITTVGGILGRVVNVKDEYIVIETGSDRNKIRVTRWAIHSVNKKADEEGAQKSNTFKVKDVKKS